MVVLLFQKHIHWVRMSSGPWGMGVGDFNNDNQSDIVIANYWSYNIGVYLGYGNGSFSTVRLYWTSNMDPNQVMLLLVISTMIVD